MNADDFWASFHRCWRASFSSTEEFEPVFEDNVRLNAWLLKKAMLAVLADIGPTDWRCVHETPFKLDAAFVSGAPDLNLGWAEGFARLHVAIEHEASEWPDVEIWKLSLIRCPLKVVFFYEFQPDSQTQDPRTASSYLSEVVQFLNASSECYPEPPGTEYLMVAGLREGHGHEVSWAVTRLTSTGPSWSQDRL